MRNFFSNLFKRKKWAYVKMITIPCAVGDRKGDVFIHLFESNLGNRKMQVGSTFASIEQTEILQFVLSSSVYHTKITRWLSGRPDPEIPTFNTVGEDDLVNALKGAIG